MENWAEHLKGVEKAVGLPFESILDNVLLTCPACYLILNGDTVVFHTSYVEDLIGLTAGMDIKDIFIDKNQYLSHPPADNPRDYKNWFCASIKTTYGDVKEVHVGRYALKSGVPGLSQVWIKDVSDMIQAESALCASRDIAFEAQLHQNHYLRENRRNLSIAYSNILGLTQLIRSTFLTDQQLEYIKEIENLSTGALSALDDGSSTDLDSQFAFPREEFDLNVMIEKVISEVHSRLKKRGLAFELICESGLPSKVVSNESMLSQVLIRVLRNAIGFTSKGKVTLSVSLHDRLDDVLTILFTVADTGTGMSGETVSALFSKAADSDADPSKTKTSAVGINICKTLVNLLGGRMWCKSEPGTGTTMYITAQVKTSDPADALPPPADEDPVGSDRPNSDIKILIIDDNLVTLTVAYEVLQRRGFHVVTAPNALEAIDMLRETRDFNAILMDLYMPDMDGITATKIIREMNHYTRIPIIALSSSTLPDDKELCLQMGLDDYLTKPIDVDTTVRTIVKWVNWR